MNSTVVLQILIVLEMILINSITIIVCSRRKRSMRAVAVTFFLMTVVLVAGIRRLLILAPSYGNGNGLFVLAGFLYLIPCYFLFDQTIKYTLTVFCSTWIYTMLTFCFSVRVGYFLSGFDFTVTVFVTQTLFYLLTLGGFFSFVRKRFIYILNNISEGIFNQLLRLCLTWFFSIVLLNFVFVMDQLMLPRILLAALLFLNVYACYSVFYSLAFSDKTAEYLAKENRTDSLTGLKNRNCFFKDAQKLIDKRTEFSVFFIDLNHFKSINDSFGHTAGDSYLIHFSNTLQNALEGLGTLYRLSGDEFLFLSRERSTAAVYERILSVPFGSCEEKFPFLGFSMGYASFPLEAESLTELLSLADSRMYEQKSVTPSSRASHIPAGLSPR